MTLEWFLGKFGYLAVLVGTFFEGETVLILGGLAAKLGYLRLPWVIVAAFLGTFAGDQAYFFLGRRYGQKMLERRREWREKSKRVADLLERHQTAFLFGFRFVYGIRTVSPFAVGMTRISVRRFFLLNAAGAFLWAVVIGVLGYSFGHGLEVVIGDIKRYEGAILLAVLACGIGVWLARLLKGRSKSAGGTEDNE